MSDQGVRNDTAAVRPLCFGGEDRRFAAYAHAQYHDCIARSDLN